MKLPETKPVFNVPPPTVKMPAPEVKLASSIAAATVEDLHIVVPADGTSYDTADDKLKKHFDVNVQHIVSIKLSGNSYGLAACTWIAEEVLKKASKL